MQNPITKKSQQGFTLIELLIVVAIIGILAAIAIPQYAKYRTSAMNSAANSELKNVQTSLEGYYTTSGNYNYPPGFTGENTIETVSSGTSGFDFQTSKEVNIQYENIGGSNQTYAVCAYHSGGNKAYAVNSTMGTIEEGKCSGNAGSVDSGGACSDCNYYRNW